MTNEEWREDEKFQAWRRSHGLVLIIEIEAAWLGYSARQPEIDALKDNNKRLAFHNKALQQENAALRAEVERLRADAERLDWLEAHPRLGEIHVDGEVKDCYLYAVSGALGVPMRAIIDAMKEMK
jgi:FtsZ-binding cell division protein ZapB